MLSSLLSHSLGLKIAFQSYMTWTAWKISCLDLLELSTEPTCLVFGTFILRHQKRLKAHTMQ